MTRSFTQFVSRAVIAATLAVGVVLTPTLPTLTSAQGMQPLQGYVVTVPAGTYMMGSVQSGVSSETARAGDRVAVTVNSPVMSGGSVALPSGTMIEGQVISVTSAGRAGRNGQMDLRFTSAILPTGQRVPLSARIQTEDGTGILKGGTAKGRAGKAALKTGGGAAAGAALGTAMGALSGGRTGRGAIYGTALGAGLGGLFAAAGKGEEVALSPGAAVNIVLDAPVTTSTGGGGMAQPQAFNQQQSYGQQAYQQQQPYSQPSNYQTYPASTNSYGQPQQQAQPYYGAQPAQQYTQTQTQQTAPYYGGSGTTTNTTNTYGY